MCFSFSFLFFSIPFFLLMSAFPSLKPYPCMQGYDHSGVRLVQTYTRIHVHVCVLIPVYAYIRYSKRVLLCNGKSRGIVPVLR